MDESKDMLCTFIVLILIGQSLPVPVSTLPACDESRADFFQEGNIGESEHFPWLGLLRVHLHEFDQLKIAVTGLVLVKERFAIANADDVNRIPKYLFMQDSKAMFIPKRGEPWYTKPKDYMIHPEFEFSTYNTIALVELEPAEGETKLPMKSVCWPGNFFNTSNQLYALGYTDDNKLMEKTMYSLQYVKPSLCKEFYNRAGFTEPKSVPTYIQCGFAEYNKKDCAWENGMALVSNSSGKWTLIGLSIRGPGCAAPARFLDMSAYLPWVESATDLEQISDYPDLRRKTAFNVGFRRRGGAVTTERPIVFRESYPGMRKDVPAKFEIYTLGQGQIHWFEMPLHLDEAGFLSADRCWIPKILVYRESMKLVDLYGNGGKLEYRATVIDKFIYNYTCMKVKIKNAVSRYPVKVWFLKEIDMIEGTGFKGSMGETPAGLLKHYPFPEKFEPTEPPPAKGETARPWKPGKHLEARFVTDHANYSGIENINVLIGFSFTGNATMDLYVYGYPNPIFLRRSTTEEPDLETYRRRIILPPTQQNNYNPREEHSHKFPRMKRKNRLEKARERAAERKARRRAMRA